MSASVLEVPPGPLVSGEWLTLALGDRRVRILDVRGRHPSSPRPHPKRAEYLAGHIPSRRFVSPRRLWGGWSVIAY